MKFLLTKKNVLFLSILGTIFFLSPVISYAIFDCYNHPVFYCSSDYQSIAVLFALFVPNLIFSLITYKMRQEIFEHWMKFAIWATPALIILTYLIMGGGNNGLGVEGAIGSGFDAMLLLVLYGIFIGVSLWRIISMHTKLKKGR